MTLFCNHNWRTSYVLNYTYNALLPAYYECTKCGKRQEVSQEMMDKIVADLKAKGKP